MVGLRLAGRADVERVSEWRSTDTSLTGESLGEGRITEPKVREKRRRRKKKKEGRHSRSLSLLSLHVLR